MAFMGFIWVPRLSGRNGVHGLALHLCFGRGASADHGHAAGELGQPLLELFFLVCRMRLRYLLASLLECGLRAVGVAPSGRAGWRKNVP
jgi:hypothetical protein